MESFSRKCLTSSAAAVVTLVLFSVNVQAGPALHSAAKQGFQDPLSNARPEAPATGIAINPNRNVEPESVRLQLDSDLAPLEGSGQGSLEQVETDDIARAVRDEFLGLGRPVTNRDVGTPLDSIVDQPDGSSASIVRALINTAASGSAANGDQQTGQSSNTDSPTPSLLDATLNNLIITILNPDLTTEGIVTFSIAGFGEFALLLLQESGGIFLVDMESGKAVKFSEAGSLQINGPRTTNREGLAIQERRSSNALQRVLELLERNVLPIVTSPITLATIVLFGIIWVVWRLSARE